MRAKTITCTAQIIPFKPKAKSEEPLEIETEDYLVEKIKYALFDLPPEQFYAVRDWMNSVLIKF